MSPTQIVPDLVLDVVDGAAAGDITLTGIKTTDKLLAVLSLDFTDASEGGTNLTDEFSITDDDTINNTGGTSTADTVLLVLYVSADERGLDLNRS